MSEFAFKCRRCGVFTFLDDLDTFACHDCRTKPESCGTVEVPPNKSMTLKPGQGLRVGGTLIRVALTPKGRIRATIWSGNVHVAIEKEN